MRYPAIDKDFHWPAHMEFLIFDDYGALLGETNSMGDALRMTRFDMGLHVVTMTEHGYYALIKPLDKE